MRCFTVTITVGFPRGSVGKESTCNAGDSGLIPGSGRSAGEGIGYPLQYSWASLVAHLVKNPPAMWETWVWSLGWEDPLEKGTVTHFSILAWRIPGRKESDTTEWLSLHLLYFSRGLSYLRLSEYPVLGWLFPMSGKFPIIISSNILSYPFFSSSSEAPVIYMLVYLMLSQRSL